MRTVTIFPTTSRPIPVWQKGISRPKGFVPEESRRVTVGLDLRSFGNRFTASVEGFFERRSHILISSGATVSGIIGIGVGLQPAGEHEYRGIRRLDCLERLPQGFSSRSSRQRLLSGQRGDRRRSEYQPYDYLYHRGNRVVQSYGLEVVGISKARWRSTKVLYRPSRRCVPAISNTVTRTATTGSTI